MTEQPPPQKPEPPPTPVENNFKLFAIVAATLALAMGLYRLLVLGQLEQSALMFIGLPTALAILLAWLPAAKTATGMIMKGITLFLLLLGILYIEGFICILMAAPFFYSIGAVIGFIVDKARAKREWDKRFRLVVLPALALMSMEGVTGFLSFPRQETVTVSHETHLSPAEARTLLARGPEFDASTLPGFLKLGFPQPQEITGGGLETGDLWRISFAGGEGKPGDLLAEVTLSEPNHILVTRISDTSHIAHWLDWQDAEWELEPTANGTKVILTMRYRRLLDPAWYFKPIERYGVKTAGEYFLTSIFGTQ
ncbi:MAG: hypothetical protein ABJQ29_02325 [Luteolibacter sp.]